MSHVYVTSDWHIGHTGITNKFRSCFPTDDVHDRQIIQTARGLVTKRDVLFILGDVTWTTSGLQKIKDAEFPCKMVMVRGNHDTLPIHDYLEIFDEVHGALKYKEFFMTHIPIHPMELYRCKNIHGHCHRGGPAEVRGASHWQSYYNAILEFNNYQPVEINQLRKTMEERSNGS